MKDPAEFFKLYDDYCFFKNPKNGFPLFTLEQYREYEHELELDEECRAEQEAENAWLRHAENQVDEGFERWEWSRLYS